MLTHYLRGPRRSAGVAPNARTRPEPLRALVVDDDSYLRRTVCRFLGHVGYDVLGAATAEEALDVLTTYSGSIRVLVSDIDLPGMPGSELVDRARKAWPQLAVVAMSGATTGYLAEHGLIPRGARVLEKPFLQTELLDHVGAALQATRTS